MLSIKNILIYREKAIEIVNYFKFRKIPFSFENTAGKYNHATHNKVLFNEEPHVQWWSLKIIMELDFL